MSKPTIILATSNGVGMGHLARASAVALALKEVANPIIVSMAGGIAEIPAFMEFVANISRAKIACGCHEKSGISTCVTVCWH